MENSRQELWSDGWAMIKAGDTVHGRKRHTDAEMAKLRQMIGALDWDQIMARCP